MKAFMRTFAAALLSTTVLLVVMAGLVLSKLNQKSKIEDHSYLVVDLYGDILEYDPPADLLSKITGDEPETLQRVLDNLRKAAVDERVDGVILKVSSNNGAGRAKLEEIRGAVKKVRAAGKKVYGFSDSIDRSVCYLISACDSVYAPQNAYIRFGGVSITTDYYRGALEKLGIKPSLHRIKDYKAAAETITRENMSPQTRENIEWVVDDLLELSESAFREERGLSTDDLVSLMQSAVLTAEEAKERGLIDDVLYWDQLEMRLKSEEDEVLRTVSQSRYAEVEPGDLGLEGKKVIAVVHAQGYISGRKSSVNPLFGVIMGHESVAADLRRVRRDKDVAAVVLRVDSPGGDDLTADLIAREVDVTSNAKPVIASMVDHAGSGGYTISYRAARILADPATLTGSIGSISGKFNVRGLHDKLGVTHDFVTRGPMAFMWSRYHDFTDEERARFEQNHWDGYNAWLLDVAERRGMPVEKAGNLAEGRLWTGRQAAANGLVDELGGFDRAVEVAKGLAGIPPEEVVKVVHYPEEQGLLSLILGGEGDVSAAVARWSLYRFLREDLAETWSLLAGDAGAFPALGD